MYLTNATILNDGPIEDLEFQAPFNEDGSPKPIVLVGSNGSGKTTLTSIVSDALIEMAAHVFRDVAPSEGNARTWFRILGNRNQRSGSAYSVSALRFLSKDDHRICYRAKCGKVQPEALKERMSLYSGLENWPEEGNHKDVNGIDENIIRQAFLGGCYAFFPVNRHEIPHWLNTSFSGQDTDGFSLQMRFSDRLDRAIIVDRAIDKIKPWILDVVMDQSVDVNFVLSTGNNVQAWQRELPIRQLSSQTLTNINAVLHAVLGRPDARVVRTHRSQRSSRLGIAYGQDVVIPSFDHLSAGQATLLSIFLTIIRYADMGHPNRSISLPSITGVVVIDEVDAHLHTDLQYNALPKLIKLFPKVQFIMTSHAPLFLLGMKNEFGDDGFQIIEMPSGLTIDAERFTEFKHSFDCYKDTKAFEDTIQDIAKADTKPLLLTEGELDVDYIKAAIDILGFESLGSDLEIDWIGKNQEGKALNGGSTALDKAAATLKHNPSLIRRKVILLYDCDTHKPDETDGLLSIVGLPEHQDTKVKHGIENMFPGDLISEAFYSNEQKDRPDGGKITLESLDKSKLRDFLCGKGKTKKNYSNFTPILEKITAIISEAKASEAA